MKISRFFTRDYASMVDRQFCLSSRQNDCQFDELCLKPFANCVVIETNTACVVCRPQEDATFVGHSTWFLPHARASDTVRGPSHVLEHGKPGCCAARDRHYRPNPFIGYQSQRGRRLSRDTPLLYILSVFSYNVRYCCKTIEVF